MRFDQIVVGSAPGDAITEAALKLAGALAAIGESDVFAMYPHPELEGRVRPLRELPSASDADVTIYHASIGEPELHSLVFHRPGRLILSYHNITPASYFEVLDPQFAALLRRGRWELRQLAARAAGAIADSEFNAAELRALGMELVEVAPPPLNMSRLLDVTPDPAVRSQLAELPGPLVLVVGQVLPHKRLELAVAAHHFLNVNHDADVHLAIVGPHRNHRYTSALIRHVRSLNLQTARITGEVTDAQLAAYYRRADVLVVPSEHEGFCVPLVEAFTLGVPVVARDFGAIAETADGAALVLSNTSSAPELCEATHRVLTDEALRFALTRRGSDRAGELTGDRTLHCWLAAFARVLRSAGLRLD